MMVCMKVLHQKMVQVLTCSKYRFDVIFELRYTNLHAMSDGNYKQLS